MLLQGHKVECNIIHPVVAVAFLNFVLLIILLIMSVTVFANPSGIELKLPYENKDARTDGAAAIINITSENVIYFNNKVVTLNDLRRLLVLSNLHNREVMIKVDRNSTMGRVSAIWDLCRSIPGVRVNVSTTY